MSAASCTELKFSSRASCDVNARYRQISGRCNNMNHEHWGSAGLQQVRWLPANYEDGMGRPRQDLPAPRIVTNKYMKEREDRPSSTLSHLHMTFGQFVDHDVTLTPQFKKAGGRKVVGCHNDGSPHHPEAMPVFIPEGDPRKAMGQLCIPFVRSVVAVHPVTRKPVMPRSPVNAITAWLDGSVVYGSDDSKTASLRTFSDGQLLVEGDQDMLYSQLLPRVAKNGASCGDCQCPDSNHRCFAAGDGRANAVNTLAAVHVLFVRLHNMVAGRLVEKCRQVPSVGECDDQWVYSEARRYVTAILQHVTYGEYLSPLLGPLDMDKYGLLPSENFVYDDTINPQISVVFSTAAFRFGHSQIANVVWFPEDSQAADGHSTYRGYFESIVRHYWHPYPLTFPTTGVDHNLRGQAYQAAQEVDQTFVPAVLNRLFEKMHDGHVEQTAFSGMDLSSLNIQRGRDHGLQGYNKWRLECGVKPLVSFGRPDPAGLLAPWMIRQLAECYDTVDMIDIFVGALSEKHVPGGAVGPTFACLIGRQFHNIKHGDRFWWEHSAGQGLTPGEVTEVRKLTLAAIICQLTNVNVIQPQVMLKPDESDNAVKSCEEIAESADFSWDQLLDNL